MKSRYHTNRDILDNLDHENLGLVHPHKDGLLSKHCNPIQRERFD